MQWTEAYDARELVELRYVHLHWISIKQKHRHGLEMLGSFQLYMQLTKQIRLYHRSILPEQQEGRSRKHDPKLACLYCLLHQLRPANCKYYFRYLCCSRAMLPNRINHRYRS